METIRETFFDELPDQRTLEMKIEAARKSASIAGFPNTSEPAKERLAVYERQYVESYGLLHFVKLFNWFTTDCESITPQSKTV